MKIRLAKLEEWAKSRPAGYLEKVIASGTIDGEFLRIPHKPYTALFREFRGQDFVLNKPPAMATPKPGLGDLVEKAIKPFAKFSDRRFGTKLSGCAKCRGRKKKLNKVGETAKGVIKKLFRYFH